MESGFERYTVPNLYHTPEMGTEYSSVHPSYIPNNTYPAKDNRYPAYAGQMSDARMVTDYRSQCSKNIKPGRQYYTKLWLINHANHIMDESRRRQIEWSGASLPMQTVPPPAQKVYSTPFESNIKDTNYKNGIGMERDTSSPDLFGTFWFNPTIKELQVNNKKIELNKFNEGGRNTVRGLF